MNKKLVLLNILLIAGLLMAAACSAVGVGDGPPSVSIQIPGTDVSGGAAQANANTIFLIYVLLGALIVIALVALLGKGKSDSS